MSGFEEWKKGGFRYRRLRRRLEDFFSPAQLNGFCIALRERSAARRLFNLFVPFEREYVFAATGNGVFVLRLRRPGVFSSKILGKAYDKPFDYSEIGWRDGTLIVDGDSYRPIAFHKEDAERLTKQ